MASGISVGRKGGRRLGRVVPISSLAIGVRGEAPDVDKRGFGGAAPEENFGPGLYLALEVAARASGGVFAVTAVASVIIFGSRGRIQPIDGILLPTWP